MKTIITIQHTESEQHKNGMIGSVSDWNLTDTGRKQASAIAAALKAAYPDTAFVLYSSDLARAKQTANALAAVFNIPCHTDPRLREFDLGEAVGKTKDWARTHPSAPLWQGTTDWAVSPDDAPFPGAETKRQVWERVSSFLNTLMNTPEEHVFLVSHDGTLSIFFALFLDLPCGFLENCNINGRSGGVSVLQADDDGRHILRSLNDMSYLNCRITCPHA